MKINTRDFGELEIDENTIYELPEGILGFEKFTRYALISPLGEDTFPMWFQAVDAPQPCFVVYDPMQIYPDYRFEIDDAKQELLKIDENVPYRVLTVAIVPDDYRQTTINLRCPLVINLRDNLAAQVILDDYDFKYPIYFDEDQTLGKED